MAILHQFKALELGFATIPAALLYCPESDPPVQLSLNNEPWPSNSSNANWAYVVIVARIDMHKYRIPFEHIPRRALEAYVDVHKYDIHDGLLAQVTAFLAASNARDAIDQAAPGTGLRHLD